MHGIFFGRVVDSLRKYEIPFAGLKEGKHSFEFQISKEFFENYETSVINNGSLIVEVSLEKSQRLLVLDFKIQGEVEVPCDRCLDLFMQPLTYEGKLFVKFGEVHKELAEDVIIMANNEHTINIAQYIYEFIHLSLPYKMVHKDLPNGESACNHDMLNKLNELITDHPSGKSDDPRWRKLKGLLN